MIVCVDCSVSIRKGARCRPCYQSNKLAVSASTGEARFWAMVDRSSGAGACWPWMGQSSGYGKFSINGRQERTHRLAWEFAHGEPFPSGMAALHTCDNPPCCNPAHIYAGTQGENVRDMYARGRWAPRRATCPKGHDRSWRRGEPSRRGRWCLLCQREYKARRKSSVEKA